MSSKADKQIQQRWGEYAIKFGWAAIPRTLMGHVEALPMTSAEFAVLMVLVLKAENVDLICDMSIPNISIRCKLSRSTVIRSLDALHDRGYIKIIRQFRKNGGQSNNHYSLINLQRILSLIGENFDNGALEFENQREGLKQLIEQLKSENEMKVLQ